MKIALFHNYYQTPGGEDRMFELEREALIARGNEVVSYEVRNEEALKGASRLKKLDIARKAAFNKESHQDILEFLEDNQVDVSHVHNWFPIISPAIYSAHKKLAVPIVQTLHNYRLGCANGTFRRNGAHCELCLTGKRSNAVLRRCYKESFVASYAWKRMIDQSWRSGALLKNVDAYICPSQEVARMHERIGIPDSKIHVLANACPDPLSDTQNIPIAASNTTLYLGRISREKGVDTLIDAWSSIDSKLLIAGSGPEEISMHRRAAKNDRIRFLGQLEPSLARRYLLEANLLVFPSRWAEPFGLSIIEAMAAGKPVIASDNGGPKEIVENGVNGLLVPPNDPEALREAIVQLNENPDRRQEIGEKARQSYLDKYLPSQHGKQLEELYRSLIKAKANEYN